MNKYSNDKNVHTLLQLMKEYGIKKVIASPGTTNIAVVGSMQYDPYFEMYSAVDERGAAYMACGLSAESGEPVAIVCTGATASRNYLPALTEAYYRKLPILVIAGSHGEENVGHLHAQSIDRSQSPKDTVVYHAFITPNGSAWYNNTQINTAFIKLFQHGGGPVLINIQASASGFDAEKLESVRIIRHIFRQKDFPAIPQGRIAVFVGSHVQMKSSLQNAIDAFCATYDAVVFCDHTSGYQGKYQVNFTLVNGQHYKNTNLTKVDLLIHIGEVSGDTYTTGSLTPKQVWRVSPDGEVRDLFHKLTRIFETDEEDFFLYYAQEGQSKACYLEACQHEYERVYNSIPEMGWGNIAIAKTLSSKLPKNSVIHFGIYNSLRTWNLFKLDDSIHSSCNVGGFGIDGATSTLIGAALANPDKLHFLVVGDLAFFYDLNALGNRHVGNNVRILLVNNGRGVEFRKKDHPGYAFGEDADKYMAAAGHFGCQSPELIKHYAADLGFLYLTASNSEELDSCFSTFLSEELTRPMLLEVFPQVDDEINNLDYIRNITASEQSIVEKTKAAIVKEMKEVAKNVLKKCNDRAKNNIFF